MDKKNIPRFVKYGLIFLLVYLISLGVVLIFPAVSDGFKVISNNSIRVLKEKLKKPLSVEDLHMPFELNDRIKSGKGISQQWLENGQRYVYVGEQGVFTYSRPDLASAEYIQLKGAQRVRVVYKSTVSTTYDDVTTRWVFIMDELGNTPLGWIQNNILGYKNSFKTLPMWDMENFGFCRGEYCAEYHVKLNARYTCEWVSQGKDIFLQGKNYGQFIWFKNVLIAKPDLDTSINDIFFINDDGSLHLEDKYVAFSLKILN